MLYGVRCSISLRDGSSSHIMISRSADACGPSSLCLPLPETAGLAGRCVQARLVIDRVSGVWDVLLGCSLPSPHGAKKTGDHG